MMLSIHNENLRVYEKLGSKKFFYNSIRQKLSSYQVSLSNNLREIAFDKWIDTT